MCQLVIGGGVGAVEAVGEGYAGVSAAFEVEGASVSRQLLDDVPEEQGRGAVGVSVGVECREKGIGALAVVGHEAGGMEPPLLVGHAKQDALVAVEGGLNDVHHEVLRQQVALSARGPVFGMEEGKTLGREADGRELFPGPAYGALPPLFVEIEEYLLRVGDVVDAVGGARHDGAAVPFRAYGCAGSEALLEEEQPHGAEVRGQLLRGGGSVGAGTVPGAVELGELRLEDVAQAQARGVVVGHGCGD